MEIILQIFKYIKVIKIDIVQKYMAQLKQALFNWQNILQKIFSNENFIVNCVSPGGIENKKLQTSIFIRNYSKNVPLRRMAKTSDIVMPILFLCSNDSNYINGHNLIVDGGLSC